MTERFLPPLVGSPTPVRFPAITRDLLASGLRVWSLPWTSVPMVAVALVLDRGAAADPPERPGLSGLSADLVDEGAAGLDAVQLADAFARLGSHLDVDVGHDSTALSFTTLSRNLDAALALLSDVVVRPHLADTDLQRIRDLRLSRLRQLKTSASAVADRAFLAGVFGAHPYGRGTLGTTRALEAVSLADVQDCHAQMFVPNGATLIVAGDVAPAAIAAMARARFATWSRARTGAAAPVAPPAPVAPHVRLVDRPGAPQSELRVGHLGPGRDAPAYHGLVALNAALGGQFTSRINQLLRETKGYTYGARTSFDFRRVGSTFACDTSVQSDATVAAITDILAEFDAVRSTRPVKGDELERAQSSLTRGYARHFETAAHLVRAAAELSRFALPDDTFDRFVPAINGLSESDLADAARRFIDPSGCVVTVVGDAAQCRPALDALGRPIVEAVPEF